MSFYFDEVEEVVPVLFHFQCGRGQPIDFNTVDDTIVDELFNMSYPSRTRLRRRQRPVSVIMSTKRDDSA